MEAEEEEEKEEGTLPQNKIEGEGNLPQVEAGRAVEDVNQKLREVLDNILPQEGFVINCQEANLPLTEREQEVEEDCLPQDRREADVPGVEGGREVQEDNLSGDKRETYQPQAGERQVEEHNLSGAEGGREVEEHSLSGAEGGRAIGGNIDGNREEVPASLPTPPPEVNMELFEKMVFHTTPDELLGHRGESLGQERQVLWRPGNGRHIKMEGTECYKRFNYITTTLHLQEALQVYITGRMKPRRINTFSCLTFCALPVTHMCARLRVLWFSARFMDETEDQPNSHGNVQFSLEADMLVKLWKHCFFVEMVTTPTRTTTRILITNTDYSSVLPPYDPFRRGGSWKISKEGRYLALVNCSRYQFAGHNSRGHKLEFLIEAPPLEEQMILQNFQMSFKNHSEAQNIHLNDVCSPYQQMGVLCPSPYSSLLSAHHFFTRVDQLNIRWRKGLPQLSYSAHQHFKLYKEAQQCRWRWKGERDRWLEESFRMVEQGAYNLMTTALRQTSIFMNNFSLHHTADIHASVNYNPLADLRGSSNFYPSDSLNIHSSMYYNPSPEIQNSPHLYPSSQIKALSLHFPQCSSPSITYSSPDALKCSPYVHPSSSLKDQTPSHPTSTTSSKKQTERDELR